MYTERAKGNFRLLDSLQQRTHLALASIDGGHPESANRLILKVNPL